MSVHALAGLTSGALKKLREEQPILRFVSMEPNIPSILVCLNAGPDHEQWYQIDFRHVDNVSLVDGLVEIKEEA